MNKQYALFKRIPYAPPRASNNAFYIMFNPPGEEWKTEESEDGKPKPDILEFAGLVGSPTEAAALIRKDPLSKYVLFHGEMMPVQIAMPVFVNGKNLDTLTSEWAE